MLKISVSTKYYIHRTFFESKSFHLVFNNLDTLLRTRLKNSISF